MPESKISSMSYTEQKAIKPTIEDAIAECLDGVKKETALNFLAYLKSLKMTPRWSNANAWVVNYKSRGVCKIYVYSDGWFIRPSFNFNYDEALFSFLVKENLQEDIWNNIYYCRGCGKTPADCMLKQTIVMGREIKGVCSCILFQFVNPSASTIECAKKLVEYRRFTIANPEIV